MSWKAIGDDGRLAPVLVQVIVLCAFIGGAVFGYWVRVQLESRAELAVVLDDEERVQQIESEKVIDLEEHKQLMQELRDAKVDKCYSDPLPDVWFDIVQPGGEQEKQLFGE